MNTEPQEIDFGPRSGWCCFCGKRLEAYWNKMLNLKTGAMSCEEHNLIETNLYKLGFVSYSDG